MVIGGDYMFKKRLTNKQMDVMNILWENDFSESYKDIIGSKKLILTSLIETETNIEELEQLENLIRKKKEELKE